jgi:hypothetical protein
VTLRSVNWKSEALANHVEISQATLHVGGGALSWDPIAFSYGPVKGTARLQFAMRCEVADQCSPQLNVHFDRLDTASLQAALLGAHQQGTVLSTLIARLTPSSTPVWPRLNATVKADSLVLGVVTLQDVTVALKILPTGAEFTSIDAGLFSGQLHATGKLTNGDKPAYELEGSFEKVQAPPFCQLLATHCTGGIIDGNGKVALSGFADTDLASSATGALHLDWRRGSVISPDAPKAIAHFDRWTADASVNHNAVTIKDNQAQQGARKSSVEATITFGDPPEISYGESRPAQTAKQ